MLGKKEALDGTRLHQNTSCKSPFRQKVSSNVYSHAYPQEGQEEAVREGFDPDEPEPHNPEQAHNLDSPFAVGDNEDDDNDERQPPVSDEATEWENRDYSNEDDGKNDDKSDGSERTSPQYASFREERNVWGSGS